MKETIFDRVDSRPTVLLPSGHAPRRPPDPRDLDPRRRTGLHDRHHGTFVTLDDEETGDPPSLEATAERLRLRDGVVLHGSITTWTAGDAMTVGTSGSVSASTISSASRAASTVVTPWPIAATTGTPKPAAARRCRGQADHREHEGDVERVRMSTGVIMAVAQAADPLAAAKHEDAGDQPQIDTGMGQYPTMAPPR